MTKNDSQRVTRANSIEILYVEDDPGDVLLTKEALKRGNATTLNVARDGVEALEFLNCEGKFANAKRPDLILLDLNMPRMDGREFLEEIKSKPKFRSIPVVVLTTSDADKDVIKSYHLQASSYITKPVDLTSFTRTISSFSEFWLNLARLPPRED